MEDDATESLAPETVEGHKNTEGSSVNNGYNWSVILNLEAKSFALSKVILEKEKKVSMCPQKMKEKKLTRHLSNA